MLRYAILGPVELREGERRVPPGGPRQVRLLALLLVNANRALSKDQLIDALWGDEDPAGAVKRLQVSILRLRRTLDGDGGQGDSRLRTVAGGYLLAVQPGELDADEFERGVEDGRRALAGGDPRRARDILSEGLALWRGPALADVAFEEFALAEIRRLEELRLSALEARLDADLQLGGHGGLIGELEALVAAHPGREHFAGQLMRALYRCGRQGEALEVYGRTRAYLSDELGLDPGPALKALQRAVLEQAPSLDLAPAAPAVESATPARGPAPLPPALARTAEMFVGRAADLGRLAGVYAEVANGARRFVTLSGEPGAGKTRLAVEFAARAHEEGALVLHGRCDEEALLPQQPFVEALRHYVGACLPHELARRLRPSGELRWMVPEIADRVPELPAPLAGDPEGARSRLFEAVCSLLWQAAHDRPLVLVLEDLHWADTSTVLLLKHLARDARAARLMILGTYRGTELDIDHPLARLLSELSREHRVRQLALAPLDAAAVGELVGDHAGPHASPELRQVVYEGTRGNAFFVVEVLRHLAESGLIGAGAGEPQPAIAAARRAVPEGVKDVISRRIARLGPEPHRVLATASVLGPSFDLDVLQALSGLGEDELVDALDAAVRARVIEEAPDHVGRYAFSHALIRNTVYGEMTATRRARLHRRAGTAIEARRASALERHLGELAHHFAEGGCGDDLDRAIEYGSRAGGHAISLLAYEQAAEHFRRAAGLIGAAAPAPLQARRCDLAIAQGEAERQAGDAAYRRTLLDAARLAQELRDPERLARAALANNRGFASSADGVDRARVAVLHAALDAYDAADSCTRAALLSLLALELVADEDWRTRDQLSDNALAMARRLGEPRTLAIVLTQHCMVQWRAEAVGELSDDLREASELAARLDDPLLVGHIAYHRADAAMEVGDLDEADRRLTELSAVANDLRQPFMRWWEMVAQAKRCSISGPAADAERRAFAAFELGQSAGQPDSMLWFLGQLFAARFLQGTLDADDPHLPDLFDTPGSSLPTGPELTPNRSIALLVSAAMSTALSEAGRADDAGRHLDWLMAHVRDELPQDYTALAVPCYATAASARLGDRRAAERLHTLLGPHAGRLVNTGSAWFGAVDHHLALLAATLGRSEEADARFAAAEETYTSLDAEPWLSRLRRDRATAAVLPRRSRT